MAEFDIALSITLPHEGGYVDNPNDPGGETNLGITMKVFQVTAHTLLGVDPTSDNLKSLTAAQAGIIYQNNYWKPIQGDSLQLQELANLVFDFYVNSGTHASTLLQTVINNMGAQPQLVVDGSIGQATLNALAQLQLNDVYNNYKQGRIAFYQGLAAKYPMFIKGWLNRVNSFPDLPPSQQDPAPTS
jgi:lysozyme family protein